MYFLLLCVQVTSPPEIPQLEFMRNLEKIDLPVPAYFSYHDCRDALSILWDVPGQLSLKHGDLMRGITIPAILTPKNPALPTSWSLRRCGMTPVPLALVNRVQPR